MNYLRRKERGLGVIARSSAARVFATNTTDVFGVVCCGQKQQS